MHVTSLPGLIVLASCAEYTALVKSGNVTNTHVWKAVKGAYCWWKPGYRDLFSCVTFLLDGWPVLCCFPSARVNWCSCASVVTLSNSVVINSLSSFFVPFSVISVLRSARYMSLLSVGVVGKPSDFSGGRREWRHFEWVFRNWFGFLCETVEEFLDQAANALGKLGEAVPDRRETDKKFYMSLAMVCKNEALDLVKTVTHKRDFES